MSENKLFVIVIVIVIVPSASWPHAQSHRQVCGSMRECINNIPHHRVLCQRKPRGMSFQLMLVCSAICQTLITSPLCIVFVRGAYRHVLCSLFLYLDVIYQFLQWHFLRMTLCHIVPWHSGDLHTWHVLQCWILKTLPGIWHLRCYMCCYLENPKSQICVIKR